MELSSTHAGTRHAPYLGNIRPFRLTDKQTRFDGNMCMASCRYPRSERGVEGNLKHSGPGMFINNNWRAHERGPLLRQIKAGGFSASLATGTGVRTIGCVDTTRGLPCCERAGLDEEGSSDISERTVAQGGGMTPARKARECFIWECRDRLDRLLLALPVTQPSRRGVTLLGASSDGCFGSRLPHIPKRGSMNDQDWGRGITGVVTVLNRWGGEGGLICNTNEQSISQYGRWLTG